MKWIFVGVFVLATAMSIIAVSTIPQVGRPGVPLITWATDINPARKDQIKLFQKWHKETYGEEIDLVIDQMVGVRQREKVIVQSLANAGPDLFDYYSRSHLERFVSSGIILDITDYAYEKGFGKEICWEGIWPSFVYDGRMYGFPDNTTGVALLYHKDLLDEAGVAYPKGDWTWDQWLEVAKKLTRTLPDGRRQFAITRLNEHNLYQMVLQNGGEMFTPNKTRCTFDSPEALEAVQFFYDLKFKYNVAPTEADLASAATSGGWGGGGKGSVNMFAAKYFAMAWGNRYWFVGFARDIADAIADGREPPQFNFGVAPMPYFKRPYVFGAARCTGINRRSKKIKYALRFLEFLSTKAYNEQLNSSYDGKASVKKYCLDENGIVDGGPPPKGLEVVDDPIWVDSMSYTADMDGSPFVAPYVVEALLKEKTQLLDAGGCTPQEAVVDFTRLVNQRIQRNIAETKNSKFRERYERALAKDRAILAKTKESAG